MIAGISPKLETLIRSSAIAEADLIRTAIAYDYAQTHHPEVCSEAFEVLTDTRTRYILASVLLEAAEIQDGQCAWRKSVEALAYLEALRVIVSHLEVVTA